MEFNNRSTSAHESHQILVLEDDPSIIRSLKVLLSKHGNLTITSSLAEAKQALLDNDFALIVTDYNLPDGTGMDLILAKEKLGSEAVLIMMTAFGSKELIIQAIEHQIFRFIEKPFQPSKVDAVVEEGLRKYAESKNLKSFASVGRVSSELIHEISNPLSIISLRLTRLKSLDLSNEGSKEGEELQYSVQAMERSTKKIIGLTHHAKSNLRNSKRVSCETFLILDAVKSAVEDCATKATSIGAKIEVLIENSIQVWANKLQFDQVLVNLISNALDAVSGLDEKWVRIKAAINEGEMTISVTDSGKGIPKDLHEKLFLPLYTTKGKDGSGLGLPICKQILESHGGSIFVDANASNTCFVIRLPSQTAAKTKDGPALAG